MLLRHNPPDGTDTDGELWRLPRLRSQLIRMYLKNAQGAQALALLQTAPAATQSKAASQEEEIEASAQTGALPALLQRFRAQPDAAPEASAAKAVATTLESEGDAASPWAVLEWNLRRAQTIHQASSSDYLAVAEAWLHTGDPGGQLTFCRQW